MSLLLDEKKKGYCALLADKNVKGSIEFTLRASDVYSDMYRYPTLSARNLRDLLNPLELYREAEFRTRCSFLQQSAMHTLKELSLNKINDKREEPLSSVLKRP